MYFFASPDQRNICKFTLWCDFQLVHQFLRNIVIHFLSVEPLFLYCDCIADLYGLQMRSDYLCEYFNYVSIKWNLSLCVCLVSWKQRNLEIRANIRIAFKIFWQRVASLVKFYTNQKVFMLSAERPKYEFSATVLLRICKQRFSQ